MDFFVKFWIISVLIGVFLSVMLFLAFMQLFHLGKLRYLDKLNELEFVSNELAAIDDALRTLNITLASINNVDLQQVQETLNQEDLLLDNDNSQVDQ